MAFWRTIRERISTVGRNTENVGNPADANIAHTNVPGPRRPARTPLVLRNFIDTLRRSRQRQEGTPPPPSLTLSVTHADFRLDDIDFEVDASVTRIMQAADEHVETLRKNRQSALLAGNHPGNVDENQTAATAKASGSKIAVSPGHQFDSNADKTAMGMLARLRALPNAASLLERVVNQGDLIGQSMTSPSYSLYSAKIGGRHTAALVQFDPLGRISRSKAVDQLDEVMSHFPTLGKLYEKLPKDSGTPWSIILGAQGGGSRTSRAAKTIIIAQPPQSWSEDLGNLYIAITLVHELTHGSHIPDFGPSPSLDRYIKEQRKNEGKSLLAEFSLEKDVAGLPDYRQGLETALTRIHSKDYAPMLTIYNQWKAKELNDDDAAIEMGKLYEKRDTSSAPDGVTGGHKWRMDYRRWFGDETVEKLVGTLNGKGVKVSSDQISFIKPLDLGGEFGKKILFMKKKTWEDCIASKQKNLTNLDVDAIEQALTNALHYNVQAPQYNRLKDNSGWRVEFTYPQQGTNWRVACKVSDTGEITDFNAGIQQSE